MAAVQVMEGVDPEVQRIQVGIRIRPLTEAEITAGKKCAWSVDGQSITQIQPIHKHHKAKNTTEFRFKHVFGPDATTSTVYEGLVAPIVRDSLFGVNGAICCYGQTSAGKTYTCQGNETEPGIIPLAIKSLFEAIRQDTDREFVVKLSYIEIYNEHVFDLLAGVEENLPLQEDKEKIIIKGLIEEEVSSQDQAFQIVEFGRSKRKTSQTNMNEHSSRSHLIFRMSIESRGAHDSPGRGKHLTSQLNFVDLAGSERISRTSGNGVNFKEGTAINKSLLFLGTVISALSRGLTHAPFRDSRLTLILKNCLGGNSRTAFIQCIAPARSCIDESVSTLRLACRIANVNLYASVNEACEDAELTSHQDEILILRERLQKSEFERGDFNRINDDLKRQNRLLQIQVHQYKTLYMRTQQESHGERSSEQADRLEDSGRIVQLHSEVDALSLELDLLKAENVLLSDSNRQLGESLRSVEAESLELRRSALFLPDLLCAEAQQLRIEEYGDIQQLERDLYSALRAVIGYRCSTKL
uniref:Kinesin-like protein n=1 Tax=Spongospora subterranea TaxID=70186 RepID=A0A0H5QSZ5_9EUKA|eukprot:CRZ05075.1 hypothetical protein [Spongospora subterranea]